MTHPTRRPREGDRQMNITETAKLTPEQRAAIFKDLFHEAF